MSSLPEPVPGAFRGLPPSGTVTFAFTDIEGSTQRWERSPAAMQDALRLHDALGRAAIAENGGYVFKTIGDAFCAAFARADDAVSAMLAMQRALGAEDFSAIGGLRVRAAIHTGTADERDGDYFGRAVNRVARLLAIGHGGQVLVSGVTSELLRGLLPPQTSLGDLGEHRLRDLALPERVYQLQAPDLAAALPPLRSLDVVRNNLPLLLKSFVGRDREVAEIGALLEKNRLVTLVGSGGIGKTQASLQVAANLLDDSADGVWFVELAPLSIAGYIPSTIAAAQGLALAAEGDPLMNLISALAGKRQLLIFDNCEHLIEPAAGIVAAILRGCSGVKILASSRQALGIEAEATFRLPPLAVPSSDEVLRLSHSDALRYSAIGLFVERATTGGNAFSLTDDNVPIVADICRRLDGIPLAIELAASRVKILSPRQLHERLDERLRVLTGGSRDVLPRQQTLRAMIDWSHDLLDEREQVQFRRLGIFVNGFALEGAVAVGEADELDGLDLLASLVDKSLVLAEPDGDAFRYRLLESTRAYALEKLHAAGEHDVAASRHIRYLRCRFAELNARSDRTARTVELTAALVTELEDVRSALSGALERDVVEGGELLAAIDNRAWVAIGRPEGIALCERYLAKLPAAEARVIARVSTVLSYLLSDSGQKTQAFDRASEAVARARSSGDAAALTLALLRYGSSGMLLEKLDEADAALAEVEAIPDLPSRLRLALLEGRSQLSGLRGDFATAARMTEQLRMEFRSLGDARGEVAAFVTIAELEHACGNTRRAIAVTQEAVPAARSSGDRSLVTMVLGNLAGYLCAVDDLPGALAHGREAIEVNATYEPDHVYVSTALEHLALVFALRGDLARAAALEGYVDAALARRGFLREVTERTTHERLVKLLLEGAQRDDIAEQTANGAALTPEGAIALALVER